MLVLVPTELEADPLRGLPLEIAVVGMGPVEAGLSALEVLRQRRPPVAFLTGLAGAYPGTDLAPGDLVLATEEVFGDLALCFPEGVRPMGRHLPLVEGISLRSPWLERTLALLEEGGGGVRVGPLVTVCCATRDPARALELARRHEALAENMEGFAVAEAARRTGVALVELRIISNLLEAPEAPWEIERALDRLKEVFGWLSQHFA